MSNSPRSNCLAASSDKSFARREATSSAATEGPATIPTAKNKAQSILMGKPLSPMNRSMERYDVGSLACLDKVALHAELFSRPVFALALQSVRFRGELRKPSEALGVPVIIMERTIVQVVLSDASTQVVVRPMTGLRFVVIRRIVTRAPFTHGRLIGEAIGALIE